MFAAFLFFVRKTIGLLSFLRALILYCKYATFSHSHQTHSLSECLQWQCRKCLYRIYGFICQTWLRLNPCQNTNIFYFFFYMKSSIASFFFNEEYPFCCQKQQRKKKHLSKTVSINMPLSRLLVGWCLLRELKPSWTNKWK